MTNATAEKWEAAVTPQVPGPNETAYTVVLVDSEEIVPPSASKRVGAVAPRYVQERDEPAFQKAWRRVARAATEGKPIKVPPSPAGGIRLRGTLTKPPTGKAE